MNNLLQTAIEFIQSRETPWTRDNSPPWGIHDADPPPYNRLYGPVHERGPVWCPLPQTTIASAMG